MYRYCTYHLPNLTYNCSNMIGRERANRYLVGCDSQWNATRCRALVLFKHMTLILHRKIQWCFFVSCQRFQQLLTHSRGRLALRDLAVSCAMKTSFSRVKPCVWFVWGTWGRDFIGGRAAYVLYEEHDDVILLVDMLRMVYMRNIRTWFHWWTCCVWFVWGT